MTDLRLTVAMTDYDHVRDLRTGVVKPQGIELTCLDLPVEEIFYRFLHHREWEVSELSFGKYVSLRSQDDRSLTAIPVFPSRVFRHSSVYVRSDSDLVDLGELAGRRVGIPEWAQTASIYSRGALAHQYGVDLTSIEWFQAGVNQPGRSEKVDLRLPDGIRYQAVPDRSLDEMLLAGDLDAVMTAHPPAEYEEGRSGVRRLLADPMAAERDYFERTGVFPIMHVVAIRSDVHDRDPWIARELLKAFEQAKRRSIARALDITAPRFPIPWVAERAAASRELFGDDFWPYGIEPNRRTLETFLGYAWEQGVLHRELTVDELFAASTGDEFRI